MFQVQSNSLEGLKPIGVVHPESLLNKRVLVRCDFNVPLSSEGKILNTLRIDKSCKTIHFLKNSKAKVVLISHIGRKKGETLLPVFQYLKKKIKLNFVEDIYKAQESIEKMKGGEVLLIENIRNWGEEEENDPQFVKLLSSFGDIFVNEAFSASHREHASITGIPPYLPTYIGFHFKEEVENLSKIFAPEHPFFVLVGGEKFETKLKMVECLEKEADTVFVGGALANDIFHAKGFEVGRSKTSKLGIEFIKNLLKSKKIFVPKDVKVLDDKGIERMRVSPDIKKGDRIVDGGPKTFSEVKKKIKESNFILWNGPFGLYEKGYSYLTKKVAKTIAKSDAFSIVGGGDTLIEISCCQKPSSYNFVSLAGGAMLQFISHKTLPGIEIIKQQ
jgi:phosphoglycerate kinase